MNHGARHAYDVHGCRCVLCVGAWNERQRELRTRRAAGRPEDNPGLNHGTKSTYVNHGCRCEARKTAQAEANRRRYA